MATPPRRSAALVPILVLLLAACAPAATPGPAPPPARAPDALWGNQFSDAATWARHNPYDLADGLRGTRLFLSAGDGRTGPIDPLEAAAGPVDSIEASISAQNHTLVDRLRGLGIAAQTDLYTPGTHNWAYWQRELHRAWPLLTGGLLS